MTHRNQRELSGEERKETHEQDAPSDQDLYKKIHF